jgi:hypothetical protein
MIPTQFMPHYYREARDIRYAADDTIVRRKWRPLHLFRSLVRRLSPQRQRKEAPTCPTGIDWQATSSR